MPLTDIMFDVDELGAWAGSAGGGAGRIPASAASIGYGAALLARPVPAGTAGAMLVSTSLIAPVDYVLTADAVSIIDYNYWGYANGLPGNFGAISPSELNGATISAIATAQVILTLDYAFFIALSGTLSQNFFNSISINGSTFLTSAASEFTQGLGVTGWQWNNEHPIVAPGTYPIEFT